MEEKAFRRNLTVLRIVFLLAACVLSYYFGKLIGYEAGIDYAVSNIQCTVRQEIK